jgi:HD-like signal output (HDOD) protein
LVEKTHRGWYISEKAQLDVTSGLTSREKLEICVNRIAHSEGVPPFSDHASEILVRTLDFDGGSSKKLVQIILQDVGLASQVLRLANSVLNNHSGRPIMSVTHATAVLGWLEVRSLASAARYLEHFANRSPGLRELVVTSVLTAVQSREVAALLGYPQPEDAYICGLFRNLGELLIACHYPEEHSQIILILAEENIPERAACLRVLDFFWDDVGICVAKLWHLPPAVLVGMDASSAAAGSPLDRCLASITNYSHNLTRALYGTGATIDSIHLASVLNPAGQAALVSARDLQAIVDLAMEKTREMLSTLHIPTENLLISKQAERARKSLESNPTSDGRHTPSR